MRLALLLALALVLCAPATSLATTKVSQDNATGKVTITGDDNGNAILVSLETDPTTRFKVSDINPEPVALEAAGTCTPDNANAHTVYCVFMPDAKFEAMMGGGNDGFTMNANHPVLARGGAGDDGLTGGELADELWGDGGHDYYAARGGDDYIVSRDGDDVGETVFCGAGVDRHVADGKDSVHQECEKIEMYDQDADGYTINVDCDDRDPARHPNATEVPDNGKDEDCSGADLENLDRDADGSQRPQDCDDANKNIRPGGAEFPGNAVDENCDGVAAPWTQSAGSVAQKFAKGLFTRLEVRGAAAGASVLVTCKGKGCPFKQKSFKPSGGKANLLPALKKRKLKPGATITVYVSEQLKLARVIKLVVSKRKVTATTRCLVPGTTAPRAC